MEKKLRNALKKYSALAGATAAVTAASGQIEYTDVNPDSTFSGNHQFDFDLNNDLIMDFRISASSTSSNWGTSYSGTSYRTYSSGSTSQWNVRIGALSSGAVLLDSSSYAAALSNGQLIGSTGNWGTNSHTMGAYSYSWSYFRSSYYSTSSSTWITSSSTSTGTSTTRGPWTSGTNRYLGLTITVGSDTYYGWARLDASIGWNDNTVTIKDYAFQTCPNIPIHAGDSSTIYAPVATSVMGADVGNNGDGTDLQISFTIPGSEVGITEYRIFVVDSTDAATFNIDSAKAVPTGDYIVHTPNAANYNSAQLASTTDVKGNLITNNKPYVIFVMSLHDGANTNDPILSAGSPVVTLMNPGVGIAEISDQDWNCYARDNEIVISGQSLLGAEYKVLDGSGRLMESGRITDARTSVNSGAFATGVYLVNISDASGSTTKKVMVR